MLHFIRPALSEPDRYINHYSIRLFCFASGIKPWTHFFGIVKRRSLHLQEKIRHTPSEVERLQDRVKTLERDLIEFKKSMASKADVRLLRDAVDSPLTELVKAVRRHERKGEYMRLSAEERFDELDAKVDEALQSNESVTQQIMQELHEFRMQNSLFRRFLHSMQLFGVARDRDPRTSGRLLQLLFLPVSLPISVSTVAVNYASQKLLGPPVNCANGSTPKAKQRAVNGS